MYLKEVFQAPGIIEIKKYHSYRWGGKKTRNPNEKETEEAVKKGNQRRAKEKLYRLLVTNFQRDDYRVDLTYQDPPPDPEEAVKRIQKFMRKLRTLYRKQGDELRYIYVTEYKGHRIHHHVILNRCDGVGRREINTIWPYAQLNYRSFRLYDGRPEDGEALATYLIKETSKNVRERIQKTRWSASKNLKRPHVKKEVIHSRHWKEEPKAPKGYQVRDVVNSYTSEGYPFQWYRLIEEPERKNAWTTLQKSPGGKALWPTTRRETKAGSSHAKKSQTMNSKTRGRRSKSHGKKR